MTESGSPTGLTWQMFDLTTFLLFAIDFEILKLLLDARDNTERMLLVAIDTVIWYIAVTHK